MSINHLFILQCINISVKTIEMHIQSQTQSITLSTRKLPPEYAHVNITIDKFCHSDND
jgi:hypothetical protein